MNEENFHKNVDDIEFKCNELISEINQHLSLYCAIHDTNGHQQNSNYHVTEQNQNQQIQTSLIMPSCHDEIINFANQNQKCKNSNILKIPLPKSVCCSITKINQLIANDFYTQKNGEDDKLRVQHLEHVNIQPKLTKQVAFQITCPKSKQSAVSNTGIFNFRYGQTDNDANHHKHSVGMESKISHLSDSNITISKNDKLKNFHDEENHHENSCETLHYVNNENQLRHFLFGDAIRGNSMMNNNT